MGDIYGFELDRGLNCVGRQYSGRLGLNCGERVGLNCAIGNSQVVGNTDRVSIGRHAFPVYEPSTELSQLLAARLAGMQLLALPIDLLAQAVQWLPPSHLSCTACSCQDLHNATRHELVRRALHIKVPCTHHSSSTHSFIIC